METDASLVLILAVVVAIGVHLLRYGVTFVLLVAVAATAYLVIQARARRPLRAPSAARDAPPTTGAAPPTTTVGGRYTRVDERVPPLIADVRFTRRFENGWHDELVALTERFMRIYYNVLVGRFEASTNLDLLRDIYEETRALYERIPLVIPPFSSKIYRFGSKNLHHVVQTHLRALLRIMRGKIKRVVDRVRKKTALI